MNRIDVEDFRGADDGGDVQITLRGGRWSNTGCFVSEPNVKRIAIDVTMDGDRLDPHLLARPNDATGNLASIGDQDLLELARIKSHIKSPQKSTKGTNSFLCILCLFVA
jgi:hypothetical protein